MISGSEAKAAVLSFCSNSFSSLYAFLAFSFYAFSSAVKGIFFLISSSALRYAFSSFSLSIIFYSSALLVSSTIAFPTPPPLAMIYENANISAFEELEISSVPTMPLS